MTSMFAQQGYQGTSMLVNPQHCPLIKQGHFEHPEVRQAFPDYSFTGYRGNPKGNFECKQVNYINEMILSAYNQYDKRSLALGQRWIAAISPEVKIKTSNLDIEQAIKFLVQQQPFCYKDPRLSYTLPVWAHYLANLEVIYICVFRHPQATVISLQQECRLPHMDIALTEEDGFQLWNNMYRHIWQNNNVLGPINFVHFNQILDGSCLEKLSGLSGVVLDKSRIQPRTTRNNHHNNVDELPNDVLKTYQLLCSQVI